MIFCIYYIQHKANSQNKMEVRGGGDAAEIINSSTLGVQRKDTLKLNKDKLRV